MRCIRPPYVELQEQGMAEAAGWEPGCFPSVARHKQLSEGEGSNSVEQACLHTDGKTLTAVVFMVIFSWYCFREEYKKARNAQDELESLGWIKLVGTAAHTSGDKH